MSIRYAILGLLQDQASTGYELKKVFEQSDFLYWTGNNNQVYRTLLELQREGHVTCETLPGENAPPRKVYTVTQTGKDELAAWIVSDPEPPEYHKSFLVRLAWADRLSDSELADILTRYEREVLDQVLMLREKQRRHNEDGHLRTRRDDFQDLISDSLISSCQQELDWISRARQKLLTESRQAI
jgi:DNA-binding PadR family transcriptional regulator